MLRENVLNIFTDGSSFQSPRSGGIGIRFVLVDSDGDEQIHDIQSLGYKNATNNQMELKACIMALEEAVRLHLTSGRTKIIVYTDSLYVVDNYKKAMFDWSTTRWHRRSGAPVLNADLWKDLIKAIRKTRLRVDFEWIKGHSKN